MPPFVGELTFNDVSLEELAVHGLDDDDAREVLSRSPKFFLDKGNRERRRRGRVQRWQMIGPDATGALLTIIIDAPNEYRMAHVVTGWRANRGERSRYHQPGGRRNRP